jgi:predicted ATPase/Tfp pilus assembly protein PilF
MSVSSPPRFPSPPTTFVGRSAELSALRGLLQSGGARLVTILGPPGMGKTRLALRYAEEFGGRGASASSWFVDLTAARTLEELCANVSSQLGVGFAETGDMVVRIAHALAARGEILVVLDNFEQLVQDGANAIATWLALAPEARFLITSREVLRVMGETPYELGPLPVPAIDGLTSELARGTSAVELLLDRAPGLELTDDNARLLAEILTSLEGIPLAIELCAARLGALGAAGVLSRMHHRLDLLNRGARDVDPRQKTLRGAIDWSWELLSPDERIGLCVCSVFAQSFDAASFEHVCAGLFGVPALEVLQSLREKSLLRALPDATRAAAQRLGIYESIRAYAAEKLAEIPSQNQILQRHAEYFAERGYEQARRAPTALGREALRWLSLEGDNLRAAYDRLGDGISHARLRAELVLALEPVLSLRGPFDRYRQMLDEVVLRDRSAALAPELGARVARARARALRQRGLLEDSVAELERSRHICQRGALSDLNAELLVDCGEVEQERGRFEEARQRYDEALLVAGSREDLHVSARAHAGLGLLCHSQGKLDEAFALYERALAESLGSGDLRLEAGLCKDIGSLRLQQARLDEAREHYGRAVTLLEELEDPILAGIVEGNLAILAQEQGAYTEARVHFANAERKLSRAGARLLEAHVRGYSGALHHELGELDLASAAYARALRVLREVGDRRLEGLFLAALGGADAARGRTAAAREAFAAAEKLLVEVGDPGLVEALELHRGFLSLASSEQAQARGDAAASHAERSRALELSRRARERLDSGALAHSDDARFALRLLERALRSEAWVFDLGRAALVPPGEPIIDLSSRPQLVRIVRALAEQRMAMPGVALSQDELLAYAWPGERMTAEAATNRMKVALSTLRKLGLRSLIQRTDDGYLLDPLSPFVLEASSN